MTTKAIAAQVAGVMLPLRYAKGVRESSEGDRETGTED